MENASKALIIAGAILISILLISLGILIYNQATNITNGQQMDEIEKSSFNSKFQQYEGTNVTGTQVRALINQVISSNSSESNENKKVSVNGPDFSVDGDANVLTGSEKIKNSGRYNVTINDYSNNGLVTSIDITQN